MFYILRIHENRVTILHSGASETEAKQVMAYQLRDMMYSGYNLQEDPDAPGVHWLSTHVDGITRHYGQLILVKSFS